MQIPQLDFASLNNNNRQNKVLHGAAKTVTQINNNEANADSAQDLNQRHLEFRLNDTDGNQLSYQPFYMPQQSPNFNDNSFRREGKQDGPCRNSIQNHMLQSYVNNLNVPGT